MNTAWLIRQAQASKAADFRVTAVAYNSRSQILSVGVNKPRKSHPEQAKFAGIVGCEHRIYLHAEIDCLVKARKQVDRLLIARIGWDNKFRNSFPCEICLEAIKSAKVNEITYYMNGDWITDSVEDI